jgi:purine-nucleoside phosphorylase
MEHFMQESQFIPEKHYHEAVATIRQHSKQEPTIGLILGSGLGDLVDEIEQPDVISYETIPHWPHSTVHGHAGKLVIGQLGGHTVLAMQGRAHFYEGYTMAEVTLPVRIMRLMGINTLIVTNAAGGLNPNFSAGDIMVIEDHINPVAMSGNSPLRGPNIGTFGPRFSINTRIYNPTLRKLAHEVAEANDIPLQEGVYVSLSGPAFETPAEVRMLRAWGGDSVGMSTAHETLVAYHTGMRILGFSSITNLSLDRTDAYEEVSHEEVLRLGREIVPRLATIIRGVLDNMPAYNPAEIENQPEA